MNITLARLAAVMAWAALPAGGSTLYKSVGPDGSLQFSDQPPADGRLIERVEVAESGRLVAPSEVTIGMPREERDRLVSSTVARANDELNSAEHALALARRAVYSDSIPRGLVTVRPTTPDLDRIALCKTRVAAARQALLRALKTRQLAQPEILTASLHPPADHP